jgi:pyruvate dehydrogenase E2 component (dihydrolipoamide acetyltransferase)
MATELEMPKLSDTMTEGTILRWLKNEGDAVEIGDEIAEIETDKATMAMEVFDEGVLSKILVPEGEKAAVGAAIAILGAEGEDVSESGSSSESSDAKKDSSDESSDEKAPAKDEPQPTAPNKAAAGEQSQADKQEPKGSSTHVTTEGGERIKISPLARKIAESKDVDISTIEGSGPGGRIIKKDVEAAAEGGSKAASESTGKPQKSQAAAPKVEAITPAASGEDKKVELSTMRKIIADRLLTSKVTIPHFYLHVEVDAAPLMALRKQINAQSEEATGNKYSVNDFIVKALINASVAVPEANASFAGDHIVQYASVGISVAVAVDDGLVTPVVKNAETKSLLQISREIKDLAARSRNKKLKPDEFDGGTVTISNLGAYGIDSFDAIVNPPQAAILSVGNIVKKPVVIDDEIKPGLRMNLGLSCDHRVVDGAVGAKFLGEIKKLIENPALMLV